MEIEEQRVALTMMGKVMIFGCAAFLVISVNGFRGGAKMGLRRDTGHMDRAQRIVNFRLQPRSRLCLSAVSAERMNLPNTLTLVRVAMIPFFMLSFVFRKKTMGVVIYILSCLTDFADGYLARKLDQKTAFGAFLDPVADKLMVGTALVFLVCQIPTWWFALPVTLILNREIAVSALREWMAEKGQRATVKVGKLGKVKTAFQMVSTAMLLEACPGTADFNIALSVGLSKPTLFSIGLAMLYLAAGLTVLSGYQYFQASSQYFQDA